MAKFIIYRTNPSEVALYRKYKGDEHYTCTAQEDPAGPGWIGNVSDLDAAFPESRFIVLELGKLVRKLYGTTKMEKEYAKHKKRHEPFFGTNNW